MTVKSPCYIGRYGLSVKQETILIQDLLYYIAKIHVCVPTLEEGRAYRSVGRSVGGSIDMSVDRSSNSFRSFSSQKMRILK